MAALTRLTATRNLSPSDLKPWATNHQEALFFILTFLISWSLWLLALSHRKHLRSGAVRSRRLWPNDLRRPDNAVHVRVRRGMRSDPREAWLRRRYPPRPAKEVAIAERGRPRTQSVAGWHVVVDGRYAQLNVVELTLFELPGADPFNRHPYASTFPKRSRSDLPRQDLAATVVVALGFYDGGSPSRIEQERRRRADTAIRHRCFRSVVIDPSPDDVGAESTRREPDRFPKVAEQCSLIESLAGLVDNRDQGQDLNLHASLTVGITVAAVHLDKREHLHGNAPQERGALGDEILISLEGKPAAPLQLETALLL